MVGVWKVFFFKKDGNNISVENSRAWQDVKDSFELSSLISARFIGYLQGSFPIFEIDTEKTEGKTLGYWSQEQGLDLF